MTIKRILILAPTVLLVFLIQSYFWVPTYEEQTRGNPKRLEDFITGSIGDASLLNPILAADSASSDITSMVFEGLIDRDRDLRFRGRLARSWEIYEEAFFYINESAPIPGQGGSGGEQIAALLSRAKQRGNAEDESLRSSLKRIQAIRVLPAREFQVSKPQEGDPGGESSIRVRAPERIKLVLSEVDQDLFENLEKLLGAQYFASFDAGSYLEPDQPLKPAQRARLGSELLPATAHHPILVFHLRPNVRFHDGHVLDAGDVKFTYEAIMDPKNLSPRIADYEPVKTVEIVDPLTVRIVYKRLYSPAVSTWGIGVLPEHLLNGDALGREAVERDKDPQTFSLRHSRFNRNPVGCGPFVFREWKSDQHIVLEHFQDYWEGAPNYARYVYRVIPDLLTQEMEFYAGTLDTYAVQPHQVQRLKDNPKYQSFSGLSFGYTYIGYNIRRAPFDDPEIRRALGMALDVDKIIRYVLYGQGERITGPFVKQTDFYNHSIEPLPHDPGRALRIMEEAGWHRNDEGWLEKDGKLMEFTLITNNGNPIREEILSIAQDSWKQIGVKVRTDRLEWAVFIQERVNKGDFDALVLGWSMGIEPDLYQIWHSSQTEENQLNFVGFQNEKADELIVKIRREYDHERQVSYCHKLHEIIAQEQPYTFLFVRKWTAVLDDRIVVQETVEEGKARYRRIEPTKTGNYMFDFNKWKKLPEAPDLGAR